MSLQVFINSTVQGFMKTGTGNLKLGLQNAPTYKLLPIHGAHSLNSNSIVSIEAVKIGKNSSVTLGEKEIDRTTLSNSLIVYDSSILQYIVDQDVILSELLDECIYYLEFNNGRDVFTTDAFLVQKMDLPINWSMLVVTFDSTLITFDTTTLNI